MQDRNGGALRADRRGGYRTGGWGGIPLPEECQAADARAARRATESRLAMDLMYATCSLSLTTAKKLAGQHTNGDVEEAMRAAETARTAYIGFVRSEAAHSVSKI